MKKHILHSFLILGLLPMATLPAANITWTNSSGGSFENAANWSSTVPGATDRAQLNTPGTYTIDLGANRSINGLVLSQTSTQADITINLGGYRFATTSTTSGFADGASFFVDGGASFTQRVNFTNSGTFATSGPVRIGQVAGNSAEVTFSNGAMYEIRGETRVGNLGIGTLRIENGARANLAGASARLDVAAGTGSTGTVIVSGTDSSLYAAADTGSFSIGYASTGKLVVTDNGRVTADGGILRLGRGATAHGILEVSDNGTLSATHLMIGEAGTAEAVLKSGGVLNAGRLDIGTGSILEVNGASITATSGTASVWSEGATYRVFLQDGAPLVQFNRLEVNYTTLDIQLLDDDSFVPQLGNFYSLISYNTSYSGLFKDSAGNILSEGDEIQIGEHTYKLSYGNGTNGQIGLTHIPEPAHIVSSAAGIILLLTLVLRRRR